MPGVTTHKPALYSYIVFTGILEGFGGIITQRFPGVLAN